MTPEHSGRQCQLLLFEDTVSKVGFFLHNVPIDFQAWKYEYEYLFNFNHFSFGF